MHEEGKNKAISSGSKDSATVEICSPPNKSFNRLGWFSHRDQWLEHLA